VPRVTIVVPCYDEAERLDRRALLDFLAAHNDISFCLVNDGSHDRTIDALREIERAAGGRVSVVDLWPNGGKAEAVRRGIVASLEQRPDLVGFWDADLATPLSELPRFIEVLDSHPQVQMVFGSRVKLLGRQIERRQSRHYFGRIAATLISETLGIPIYDSQCGAKLFRVTPELATVFGERFLSQWIFDVEILARYIAVWGTARTTSSVVELPLMEWRDVRGSKIRGKDFLVAAKDLWRIRRAYHLPRTSS
jgi:dolichyl-phosphate beta-glucosyltransferase